jgi:hypothetical protein
MDKMENGKRRNRPPVFNVVMRKRKPVLVLAAVLLACCAAAIFAARAYNPPAPNRPNSSIPPQGIRSRSRLESRLGINPQADRMRRRLGQRFIAAGREIATLTGTLTMGGQTQTVTIIRRQDDDSERVSVSLGGGPTISWSGAEGARSAGQAAAGEERKLIERITLDSPDQFILAQLRSASYYTVAERVMPQEAAGSESYSGPLWDIVRVGEPNASSGVAAESPYRLYYINSSTGLIEKILSNERGRTVTAEILEWTQINGERLPARIAWKVDNQAVMELNLSNVSHGPRQ